MKQSATTAWQRIYLKIKENWPVIIFSIVIFYSVYLVFGTTYILIVFPNIIAYKAYFGKCVTVRQLINLTVTQFLMVLLAFFATLNLPLCILLNLTVPFLLVHIQTSQFNPQGYFTSAVCFTFLQLHPVGWQGLPIQFAIMAYGMAALAVLLSVYSYKNRHMDFTSAQKGLLVLSGVLREKIDPGETQSKAATGDMFKILHGFYNEAYKSRGLVYVVNRRGRIHYMLALLFQRTAYFLSNPFHAKTLSDERCRKLLTQLARYMELAGTGGFHQDALIEQGRLLLSETDGGEDPSCTFVRNFLHLFLLLLKDIRRPADGESTPRWKSLVIRRPLKKLFTSIKMDRFETRFALRLSVLLTVTFATCMISKAELVYWFALNSFLLLRPICEESVSRVKARFAGTIAGCLIIQLLLFMFPGNQCHVILASIAIAGMYLVTTGTWQKGLFSTSFALSLSTLALPKTLAMELRLFYVIAAIFLVLIISRFFFPTSAKDQFRYNVNQLFHLHHVYLQLLEKSLTSPPDYGAVCDLQIHYHLTYGQLLDNLVETENGEFIRKVLKISWHMSTEAEQMLYLINSKRLNERDIGQMGNYLKFNAFILNDIQTDLNVKTETIPEPVESNSYKRSLEDEPRLSCVMEQYSKHVSLLYRSVCSFKQRIIT